MVSSGWLAAHKSDGGTTPVLDVARGSAFSGIHNRPDVGTLRRLATLLANANRDGTAAHQLVLIDCQQPLNGLARMAWTARSRVLVGR